MLIICILISITNRMAQQPTMKFNSNSKGFSLGWDAPDVKSTPSKSFHTTKTEPADTLSNTRGTKFLEKKVIDVSLKVGSSGTKLSAPQVTPKITRNDKERSTFYFGDLPPSFEGKVFKKKEMTEKEVHEDGVKYETTQKLKEKSKKEEIERMHNQNISKIQENAKKRQSFRF